MTECGPCAQFNPFSYEKSRDGLQEVYTRASRFFVIFKDNLIQEFQWRSIESYKGQTPVLFALERPAEAVHQLPNIALPVDVDDFFIDESFDDWRSMFELGFSCGTQEISPDGTEQYYIKADQPLQDMFYLLQCVVPNMFTIWRKLDSRPMTCSRDLWRLDNDRTMTQYYPSIKWREERKEMLREVLGEDGYEELMSHIYDPRDSWDVTPDDPYYLDPLELYSILKDNDSSSDRDSDSYIHPIYGHKEMKDYTACSSDCGYCGMCY